MSIIQKPWIHFGYNITSMMDTYIADVFTPWFRQNFPGEEFVGVITYAGPHLRSGDFEGHVLYTFSTTEDEGTIKELLDNVVGKFYWFQDTGLDSSEAKRNPQLVRGGQFVKSGWIANHEGFSPGGSGVREESDAEILRTKILDEGLIPIMNPIGEMVMNVTNWANDKKLEIGTWKFLHGPLSVLEEIIRMYNHALANPEEDTLLRDDDGVPVDANAAIAALFQEATSGGVINVPDADGFNEDPEKTHEVPVVGEGG